MLAKGFLTTALALTLLLAAAAVGCFRAPETVLAECIRASEAAPASRAQPVSTAELEATIAAALTEAAPMPTPEPTPTDPIDDMPATLADPMIDDLQATLAAMRATPRPPPDSDAPTIFR